MAIYDIQELGYTFNVTLESYRRWMASGSLSIRLLLPRSLCSLIPSVWCSMFCSVCCCESSYRLLLLPRDCTHCILVCVAASCILVCVAACVAVWVAVCVALRAFRGSCCCCAA